MIFLIIKSLAVLLFCINISYKFTKLLTPKTPKNDLFSSSSNNHTDSDGDYLL